MINIIYLSYHRRASVEETTKDKRVEIIFVFRVCSIYSDPKNSFRQRKLTVDLDRENSRPFLLVSYIYILFMAHILL